jgi:formyl-CoA transferase
VLGRPELGDDERFATSRGRVQHVEEVDGLVEAWTEKHTKHEAMAALAGAGVPCGAVLDSGEILTNQHLIERGMIVDVEHPMRGRMSMPANPVRLSDSPTRVTRAPLLGEHNGAVLGELLGYSAADVAALERDGIV